MHLLINSATSNIVGICFIVAGISDGVGCTRGAQLKVQVYRQYLFDRASFVDEVIASLIQNTSKAKRPDSKPRGRAKDLERIGVIDLTSDEDNEELTEVEVAMNNNELLRC